MRNVAMMQVAARTGIHVRESREPGGIMHQILATCERDEARFLDVVDATLNILGGAATLKDVLHSGYSVWTAAPDGKSLERRVEAAAAQHLVAATTPADAASAELREA